MHARFAGLLQRYLGLYLYRVMARPLEPLDHTPAGAVRFVRLGEVELLGHCGDAELELAPASVHASFERGDLCVGALQDQRLLGYVWFAFGATPEAGGTWVEFDRRSAYTYRHFVRPGCRGAGLAAGMLRAADGFMAQRGLARCVTLIYTYNRASIRASARSGALAVGRAACLRLFGRTLSWRSPGAKREGLRFFRPQSSLSRLSLTMRRLASMLAVTASRN